jgi:hypothetical protein
MLKLGRSAIFVVLVCIPTSLSACGSAPSATSPIVEAKPVARLAAGNSVVPNPATTSNPESETNVISTGSDADVVELFQSPHGPLSGPETRLGTVDEAASHLGFSVPSPVEFGQVKAVGFDDGAVKILYEGKSGNVLTVESSTPIFRSRDDIDKLAAQYADAPTTNHPTRVSVVSLAASGLIAIVFDPVYETGPTPNVVRSATFDIGKHEFTVYLTKARDEAALLAAADQLALEVNRNAP